jgi:RNA polymerase sigma-70 factor (ECF subfamily)
MRKGLVETAIRDDFLTLVKLKLPKVTEPVNITERLLIKLIKSGDSAAFSSLFNAYYKDLVLYGFRFTKDIVSSEEIVQDVFVKLWEERELIGISSCLKSYVIKMVRNRCIDLIRHRNVVQKHSVLASQRSPALDFDTDSYILYSELQEKIDSILVRLPDDISEAFRMSRDKGLKYNEIAKLKGVSVRTVEVRIGKALHLLRKHLSEYFQLIVFILTTFSSQFLS